MDGAIARSTGNALEMSLYFCARGGRVDVDDGVALVLYAVGWVNLPCAIIGVYLM